MSTENDFLVFAGQSGANVVTQAAYAGQTWQQAGFVAGLAPSAQLNKVWRQSSVMASVIAQFIVNNSGQPAIDDGTTATLLANLQSAVGAVHGRAIFTATGSFTAPVAGIYYFSGCAGGGGGAGALSATVTGNITGSSGGGGCGQAAIRTPITLTAGQVVAITPGAAGAAGAATGGNGGNGGNTVFGALLTLTGGSGGTAGTGGSTSTSWSGGAGGAGFPAGGDGCDVVVTYCGPSGTGASGPFGGGGGARRGAANSSLSGNPAVGYGAGGSGAGGGYAGAATWVGSAGGAGAPGVAIIDW
jgi:hypothetical protein